MKECTNIPEKRIGREVAKKKPRVSIVTPAFNAAGQIAETLDSALAQTFRDHEIIVVNDGSPDSAQLELVLTPYFDSIIYIRQENKGAAAARNTAIETARGEFIAFLDSDDIWMDEKLEEQIKFLDSGDFQMVYCNAEYFGEKYYRFATFMETSPSQGDVTPESLITADCNVITSGTVVRKDALDKFGAFDLNAPRTEDFELWFRLSKNGVRIGYLSEVLLKYRVSMSGLSGDNIKRAERNIMALEVIRDRNELTASEENVWQKQIRMCRAQLDLEKAKTDLVNEDFAGARVHFNSANKYYRSSKYTALIWLLGIYPKLALLIFRKIRPAEFDLITPGE